MINDFEQYAAEYLKILTKQSTLQPLKLNWYQKQILLKIKHNKPIRLIILKPRQIGISTFCSAYTYWKTATNFYTNATIIARDVDSTNNIFGMCKTFYDYCPPEIRPMRRYSNSKEIFFHNPNDKTRDEKPGLNSSIGLETAGKLTAGRSGTKQILHLSEFAFWDNADIVVTGLFQVCPIDNPESIIIIESTANGVSGKGLPFYKRWQEAESGNSDFIPIFFPYYKEPTYTMIYKGEQLTTKEEQLLKTYGSDGLTVEHLMWRRYKIKNEMGSATLEPEDQFKQEYPVNSTEAFIMSGRPVFDAEKLMALIHKADHVNCTKEGFFIYYKRQTMNGVYAIGVDVAEGLEDGDYSAAVVLDENMEQVASYHAHIDPDVLGVQMCELGKKYNNAVLCIEINNHGLTTVNKVRDLGYNRIYTRRTTEQRSDKITSKLGWRTTAKTKAMMLDRMVEVFRDDDLKIKDIALLREMTTIAVEPDGNVILNGKDRVVACCLALQGLTQATSGRFKAISPARWGSDEMPQFEKISDKFKYYDKKRKVDRAWE